MLRNSKTTMEDRAARPAPCPRSNGPVTAEALARSAGSLASISEKKKLPSTLLHQPGPPQTSKALPTVKQHPGNRLPTPIPSSNTSHMQHGNISATATAGVAVRAQLSTHALLQSQHSHINRSQFIAATYHVPAPSLKLQKPFNRPYSDARISDSKRHLAGQQVLAEKASSSPPTASVAGRSRGWNSSTTVLHTTEHSRALPGQLQHNQLPPTVPASKPPLQPTAAAKKGVKASSKTALALAAPCQPAYLSTDATLGLIPSKGAITGQESVAAYGAATRDSASHSIDAIIQQGYCTVSTVNRSTPASEQKPKTEVAENQPIHQHRMPVGYDSAAKAREVGVMIAAAANVALAARMVVDTSAMNSVSGNVRGVPEALELQGKMPQVASAADHLQTTTAVTQASVPGCLRQALKPQTTDNPQRYMPGQVIHYCLNAPGQQQHSSSDKMSTPISSVLDLEILECFGVGKGELYHVRLLADAAVPESTTSSSPAHPGRQMNSQQHQQNAASAAGGHNADSQDTPDGTSFAASSTGGRVCTYCKGQEFALKLGNPEASEQLTEGVEHVSVVRQMLREGSRSRLA